VWALPITTLRAGPPAFDVSVSVTVPSEWDSVPVSHAHSHDGRPPASHRASRLVNAILVPCGVVTLAGLILLWPGRPEVNPDFAIGPADRSYAEVLSITLQRCSDDPSAASVHDGEAAFDTSRQPCGVANVHITSGRGAGTTVAVALPRGPGMPSLAVGDEAILTYYADAPENVIQFAVIDHQRGRPMLYILALSALAIVAFGRWRGLSSLAGLGVCFAGLLLFIIPGILSGHPPLLVAIVGSAAIMFAVLYLTHGFNVHTSVAVLGTVASLIITGVVGVLFTAATKLTGFGTEETMYLSILHQQVDMRGLLLAGFIIGTLGVLDDVTVTQAVTVAELARTAASRGELYHAATRVGRAHVASAVNTIVLAYAGASLPLLLLVAAGGRDVSDLLTSQFLAQEIVRSVVATLGLVAAVPVTTALATLVADLHNREKAAADGADLAVDAAPNRANPLLPGTTTPPGFRGARAAWAPEPDIADPP
jgi:uncharacterized membrane protein